MDAWVVARQMSVRALPRRFAAPIARPILTNRQGLPANPGWLPAIRLGDIGGPKDANSHSMANPVGQVAGATDTRTPPVACPNRMGGVAKAASPSGYHTTVPLREHYLAAPSTQASTPFCACSRFSASSNTTDCGPSITSSETSSPR